MVGLLSCDRSKKCKGSDQPCERSREKKRRIREDEAPAEWSSRNSLGRILVLPFDFRSLDPDFVVTNRAEPLSPLREARRILHDSRKARQMTHSCGDVSAASSAI